jgi:hypothetical protein
VTDDDEKQEDTKEAEAGDHGRVPSKIGKHAIAISASDNPRSFSRRKSLLARDTGHLISSDR